MHVDTNPVQAEAVRGELILALLITRLIQVVSYCYEPSWSSLSIADSMLYKTGAQMFPTVMCVLQMLPSVPDPQRLWVHFKPLTKGSGSVSQVVETAALRAGVYLGDEQIKPFRIAVVTLMQPSSLATATLK